MQLIAPEAIASFSMDGVDYARDANGLFKIDHPEHVKNAMMHGALAYTPGVDDASLVKARVESEFADDTAKDDRIRDLEDMLRDAIARLAAAAPPAGSPTATATDGPREVVSGPGSTSPAPGGGGVILEGGHTTTALPQGQAGDIADAEGNKLAKALDDGPNFDEMGRDALVAWLQNVGIAVSGNVSKEKAREIVNTTVNDYHEGKAEAAAERQSAMNSSTGHDTMPTK